MTSLFHGNHLSLKRNVYGYISAIHISIYMYFCGTSLNRGKIAHLFLLLISLLCSCPIDLYYLIHYIIIRTDKMRQSAVTEASKKHNQRDYRSIQSLFQDKRPSFSYNSPLCYESPKQVSEAPSKMLQEVELFLISWTNELPIFTVSSRLMQDLNNISNGRMLYLRKEDLAKYLLPKYTYICGLLRESTYSALTGSVRLEGWITVLGTSFIGVS